jgi:hypothetical protein
MGDIALYCAFGSRLHDKNSSEFQKKNYYFSVSVYHLAFFLNGDNYSFSKTITLK